MDNKNKDIKNKDNNNLENKDTNNNDIEQKNINEMSPEELDKAIIDLLEKMGAENDIKIINGKPKYGFKTKVIGFLKLLFSFIVLVALTGFINWIQYDKFYIALFGMLTIVCVDFIIGKVLMRFFMITVLKTFGVLKLLAPVMSFILVCLFFPGLEFPSVGLIILIMIMYVAIKLFFFSTLNKIYVSQRSI